MDRRTFLRLTTGAGVAFAAGSAWPVLLNQTRAAAAEGGPYGALMAADANGLQLPAGFSSRVVATTGTVVPGSSYAWHAAPDGGACFPVQGGGWVYVSNAELDPGGGAASISFDASGNVVGARRILSGTRRNCAGGATPWGSWLSCEEVGDGYVYETDPLGLTPAARRDALGRFNHEAAAVDPVGQVVYLTEDMPDGGLYRFRPSTWPNLESGTLEVMTEAGGVLGWSAVPNPGGSPTPTRDQVASMKVFNGGEGAWFDSGALYVTTKGDNRVWKYVPATSSLTVVYDDSTSPNPVLTGVDNVTVAASGDIFVAEDGGNMELVLLPAGGGAWPFLRLGVSGSEITGPAFDPSGSRLYFSSQRNPGKTFEVTGPFRGAQPPPSPSPTPPGAIALSARGYKSKGKRFADLSWTGATTPSVEVRRNGVVVATTANDGAHTDTVPGKGGGTFTYQLREVGGSRQSNQVPVTF